MNDNNIPATTASAANGHRLTAWMLAGVMALLFAIWQYWTPVQMDDLWMQAYYNRFADRYGAGTFRAWLEYAEWFRVDSNGRLANYLAPIVTLYVPRWLFAAMTGIFVGLLYMLVVRLSGLGRRYSPTFQWRWMALVWAASMVLFPWRDHLMLADYALNYVYATVFDLLFVWAWLTALSRRLGAVTLLGACVAALVGGMMHEGLAVPLLAGCGVVVLMRRFRLPWQAWLLLVLFAFSSLESVTAPGILARAGRDMGFSPVHNTVVMLKSCTLLLLLLAVIALGLWLPRKRHATRRLLVTPPFVLCLTAAVVSAVFCLVLVDASARFGWLTQILSAIGIGMTVRRTGRLNSRFWGGLALLAAVLTASLLMNVISEQKKVYSENDEIMKSLHSSENGTVFRDIHTLEGMDKITTLALVEYGNWNGAFQIGCVNLVYPEKEYAVVPEGLADFNGNVDTKYPGETGMCGYKGHKLSPMIDHDAFDRRAGKVGTVWLSGVTAVGDTVAIWADSWPFRDRSGRQWLFYRSYMNLDDYVRFDFKKPE